MSSSILMKQHILPKGEAALCVTFVGSKGHKVPFTFMCLLIQLKLCCQLICSVKECKHTYEGR